MTTALFLGRFQPFHNNHLAVLKELLQKHDKVIIALGSAQESNTPKNPFTATEREEMIARVLKAEQISNVSFIAVNDHPTEDGAWIAELKQKAPKFDVAVSNTQYPRHCFAEEHVPLESTPILEGPSGTEIRDKIARGVLWEVDVPSVVANYLLKIQAPARLKALTKE